MQQLLDHFYKFKTRYIYAGIVSLVFFLGRKYFNGPWCPIKKNMSGKFIIITGGNTGMGKETATELLEKGAEVLFACRSEQRAKDAINTLPEESRKRATFLHLDLCDLDSVYSFTQEVRKLNKPIDLLINNAGLTMNSFSLTKDGIESTLQANHFGHMALTILLLDLMNKSESRVINVSSKGYTWGKYSVERLKALQDNLEWKGEEKNYGKLQYYCDSKLANVYFTKYLAENLENKLNYIKTMSVCPGLVLTDLNRDYWAWGLIYLFYPFLWYISKSIKCGAQNTLYLCYEDFEKIQNGEFYSDCQRTELLEVGKNNEIRNEFIKWSYMMLEKAIGKKFELPTRFK